MKEKGREKVQVRILPSIVETKRGSIGKTKLNWSFKLLFFFCFCFCFVLKTVKSIIK